MAEADLPTPPQPSLGGLRRVLFGLSGAEARAELSRLEGEDLLAHDAWLGEVDRRERQRDALMLRRQSAVSVLDSVRATAAALAAQVEVARLNAERVETAAAGEIEQEIQSLRSSHTARIQDAHRQLLAAARRRLELERSLARAMDRLEEAAREVVLEPGAERPPAAPVEGPAVETSEADESLVHLVAVLIADDDPVMPPVVRDRESGHGRLAFDGFHVAVQTRAGVNVGELAALVVREPGHRVVAYELTPDRGGARSIAAGDVLALRPGVVVVRSGYRVLGPGALPKAGEGVAPLRVVEHRRPAQTRPEGGGAAGPEELPRLPAATAPPPRAEGEDRDVALAEAETWAPRADAGPEGAGGRTEDLAADLAPSAPPSADTFTGEAAGSAPVASPLPGPAVDRQDRGDDATSSPLAPVGGAMADPAGAGRAGHELSPPSGLPSESADVAVDWLAMAAPTDAPAEPAPAPAAPVGGERAAPAGPDLIAPESPPPLWARADRAGAAVDWLAVPQAVAEPGPAPALPTATAASPG